MRGGKTKGKKGTKRGNSKARTATNIAMTISVAEEVFVSSAGTNKACSNRESRKDKYGDGEGTGVGSRGTSQKRSLCYGSRLGKKLLYLRRIWAHGLPL